MRSWSIITHECPHLRRGQFLLFMGIKYAFHAKRELLLPWSQQTQKNFQNGPDETYGLARRQERKRLDVLTVVKVNGGSFRVVRELEQYLAEYNAEQKHDQRLMDRGSRRLRRSLLGLDVLPGQKNRLVRH